MGWALRIRFTPPESNGTGLQVTGSISQWPLPFSLEYNNY